MGYLAPKIFLKTVIMCYVMCFNVYFKIILNMNLLFSIKNNDIITARMLGLFGGICSHRGKLEKE